MTQECIDLEEVVRKFVISDLEKEKRIGLCDIFKKQSKRVDDILSSDISWKHMKVHHVVRECKDHTQGHKQDSASNVEHKDHTQSSAWNVEYKDNTQSSASNVEYKDHTQSSASNVEHKDHTQSSASNVEYKDHTQSSALNVKYKDHTQSSASNVEYKDHTRGSASNVEYKDHTQSSASNVKYKDHTRGSASNVEYKDHTQSSASNVKYKDHTRGSASNVLFTAHFTNNTDQPQTYALRTERHTKSTCEISLQKCYTRSGNIEFKLTPYNIGVTAGFKTELGLTTSFNETFEEDLSWSIDNQISVPPKFKTKAELEITEEEFIKYFETESTFQGVIHVTVHNKRGDAIKTIHEDVTKIFPERFFNVNKDAGVVSFKSYGMCKFRFGIDQHVKLIQSKITDEEGKE